jgi:alpha-tubulin suppressor-like RCC1 family protein
MAVPRIVVILLLAWSTMGCGRPTSLQGRVCPCAEGFVCCGDRCVLGPRCPSADAGVRDGDTGSNTSQATRDAGVDDMDAADDRASGVKDAAGVATDAPAGVVAPYIEISAASARSCVIRANGSIGCWGTALQIDATSGPFMKVSSGRDHVCALGLDGAIKCWGNCYPPSTKACTAPPSGSFKSLSNSFDHTCAVADSGAVYCWGSDSQTPPPGRFEQVSVGANFGCGLEGEAVVCWGPGAKAMQVPPSSYVAVAAASDWACGLTTDGAVSCWGSPPLVPRAPEGAGQTALAIGTSFGCTLDIIGTLKCWAKAEVNRPLPSSELHFRRISIGDDMLCGVTVDGEISCMGTPLPGRGAPVQPVSAVSVGTGACWITSGNHVQCSQLDSPSDAIVRISASEEATCGVTERGDLLCWGDSSFPVSRAAGPFRDVAVGIRHACALRADGTVRCWGNADVATAPSGIFTTIAAGGAHTCGLSPNGDMKCWGVDGDLQLIAGRFVSLACGQESTCAITATGDLACRGVADLASVPTGTFTQVSVAESHACGLRGGQGVCWGSGLYDWRKAPEGPFTSISVSEFTGCGIRPGGRLVCWGGLHWPDEPRPSL